MTTTASSAGSQLATPSRLEPRDLALGRTAAEKAETIAGLVRAVGEVESMIRTATAWRTELLDAARRAVELAPEAMLAPELEPDVWRCGDAAELARRALVADVATTLTLHERTAARLLDDAELIVNTLPGTAGAMRAGRMSYRHAQALVEHTADLDPADRRAVEAAALPLGTAMPPGAFDRHVARTRERLLAEPLTARHERAASHRSVRVEPARDGMAFLTAYLPATTACAAVDRIDRAVDLLRGPDEPRTADQLRADVLSALLLDDGTLDLVALAREGADPAEFACVDDVDGARADAADGLAPDGPHAGSTAADGPSRPTVQELLERLRRTPIEPDDSPRRVAATRATMARLARNITPQVTVTVPALTLLETLAEDGTRPRTSSGTTVHADPGRRDRTSPEPGPTDSDDRGASPPRCEPARPAVRALDAGLGHETAYLDGYGPIDDRSATILAARAPSFRRLLTHPHTGAVLSVGRDSYVVPADLRAFLRLRDETCRFPGCSRRAARCDVDHTVAYVSGGTTAATNLAHLCRAHHRLKHATRWDARQVGSDGTLAWSSPTGGEHVTRPVASFSGTGLGPPPF